MTVESYLNKIEKSITSGTIEENYESTFYTFNNQFSKYFINSLSKDIRRYLSEGSIEMLEKQFYSEIYYLTIRTLIDDFYNWQRVNESVPKEERYHRYCLKLGTVPFFKKIKKAYPVLFIKIFHLHQHTINLIEEAMLSIIRDKDEIKERIGFNFDDGIKEIVLSTGDRHNGGKTAVIFKNNNDDKILYKPHSLNNDVFLENFFSLVNRSLPLKLYHPKSISKKNYGWQEFIEFQECNLDNDYEDYFYRYGELLAIAYALQVTDLHKENIIMSKNYPIVIDSETLFTNPDLSCNRNSTIQNPETVHDLFQKFIKDSVLDTLLLPNNFQSSLFDFDLSPLTNYQQLSENITRFTIENDFSHNIHLKEVHVVLPSSNVKKETNKFYGKIIDGFKACYTILENSKNYFIEEIKLLSEKYPLYLRQVLRPTMVYVKFLEASTHPDYLTDIKNQRKLFQKLNSSLYKLDSTLGKQVEIEINSLMKGDVPYFYTKFNSLSIYSMENKICNFYATSIQSKLLERFQKLGNKDMLKQLHVIFLSLSTVKDTTFSDINQSPLHDFIIPLTSSVLSTTSKHCFEQPEASFLVCSLVFIEYNTLLEVGLNFLISLFTFTFDILYPIVKVGHTDDYSHGAVKLSVSLVDKDAMKKISVTVIGYFEINIDENITDILYVNGTAILYHYLRSIVSIVSAIDSSEAMLLPTINVLELLDKSQPFEEE
ncbi:lantibiotic synthetase [Streptococcus pneumoniae]|nr:lantibiotic synthetase [Streptococcus pneumoniae]